MFLIIDAGIEIRKRAAPIIKYMITLDENRIRKYCEKKNWKIITNQESSYII